MSEPADPSPDPSAAPPDPAPVRVEPCRLFRSRGMYQYAGMEDQVDVQAHDGEMWCLNTGTDSGPDGAAVSRAACRPGRGCYETI
jgi:hypothetical protein